MARRALAAVAVVGIAAVGLTACSGSKDKTTSGSSEGKSLVVTYYKTSSFPQIEDFMKRAKEEFESTHKDVTIDLQPVEAFPSAPILAVSTTTRRSLSRQDCPLTGSLRAGMTCFLLRAPSRKRCPTSSP